MRESVRQRVEVGVDPLIKATPHGLVCDPAGPGALALSWSDVLEVRAFKLDLLTEDEVRLRIRHPAGTLEISESQPGFEEAALALERAFPTMAGWRDRVIEPAFARNEVVLVERAI